MRGLGQRLPDHPRPVTAHFYHAERRDDPAVVLTAACPAACPAALRELIRADYWARPVPREVAP